MNMVHWRENYVSYSENVKWPVCHYDEPLGTQVYLEFGGSGGDGDGGAVDGAKSLANVRSGGDLSFCSVRPLPEIHVDKVQKKIWYDMMDQGRWVTTWDYSELASQLFTISSDVGYNPKYPGTRIPGGTTYLNGPPSSGRGVKARPFVGHEKYLWTPYQCKLIFFTPEMANKCLRGKSVEMRGDSHMRQLFNALTTYSCGCGKPYCNDGGGAIKGWGTNQCLPGTCSLIFVLTTIKYLHDQSYIY